MTTRRKSAKVGRAIAALRFRPNGRHLWIVGATALVGIAALNATLLQPGSHPAPLFSGQDAVSPKALSVRTGPIADPEVRALQSRLKAMGLYTGALDGLMGQQTLSAVYEALDEPRTPRQVATAPRQVSAPSAGKGDGLSQDDRQIVAAPVARSGDPLGDLLKTPPRRVASTPDDAATPSPSPSLRSVQERLVERGYDPGPLDGMMGSATRTALSAFQKDVDLPATGQADGATLEALGFGRVAGRG